MAIPNIFNHQKGLLDHQGAVNMNSESKKTSISLFSHSQFCRVPSLNSVRFFSLQSEYEVILVRI